MVPGPIHLTAEVVDFVSGETKFMLKAPAGANLGVHHHYGSLVVYTVQGAWAHAEHDWVSRAGDFVYEVANSRHTFIADEGDEVVVSLSLQGPIAFLGEGHEIVGIETAHSFAARYEAYCAEHGLEPVDLTEFARR